VNPLVIVVIVIDEIAVVNPSSIVVIVVAVIALIANCLPLEGWLNVRYALLHSTTHMRCRPVCQPHFLVHCSLFRLDEQPNNTISPLT